MTTGVRPTEKTVSFRVKTYKELCEKFKVANDRMSKKMGQEQFNRMVQQIVFSPPSEIQRLAADKGFLQEWWEICQTKVATKRARAC